MVNKYRRKTRQASWDKATMKLAMEESKKTSVSAAAKKYNITLSTLQRHLKTGSSEKKLGRFQRVFTDAQEIELLEYVFHVDALFHGLTKTEFLALVYQYAEKNNIAHPFKGALAGNDWYRGFKKRHPDLTIRQPEPTSVARARGFNKPQVYRFYDLLEAEIDKHVVDATRIYNMDETGIQTTSNKPPKILTKTGKKQVGVISSVERGKLTTVICCCNAAGSFIPPFLIYGRKRMVGRLLDGAPPGTNATCTDNGWINGPKFLEWLRHFVEVTRPSPEKKVILVMDNHESHKYLAALEYASQNNVIFVSLPPHTTHRMQPLDRCVYRPLKCFFEQEVSIFQKSHVGRIISQYDVALLFGKAYMKAASAQNAISGFSSTGIWPPNRYIFDDSEFLPSTLTDRPEPSTSQVVENIPAHTDGSQTATSISAPTSLVSHTRQSTDSDRTVSPSILDIENCGFGDITESIQCAVDKENSTTPAEVPPSSIDAENVTNTVHADVPSSSNDVEKNLNSLPAELPLSPNEIATYTRANLNLVPELPEENPPTETDRLRSSTPVDCITLRSVSVPFTPLDHFKPVDIKPLPTLSPNKTTRKRKIQRAEILTSTPIKEQQKEKEQKRKQAELKSAKNKNKTQNKNLPSTSETGKAKKKTEKNKPCTRKTKKTDTIKKSKKSTVKYVCLVCGDPYIDPPDEDWIQCGDCAEWAHEDCTSYIGRGSYFCDLCHE